MQKKIVIIIFLILILSVIVIFTLFSKNKNKMLMLSDLSLDFTNIEITVAYETNMSGLKTIILNSKESKELYDSFSNIQFIKKDKYKKQFDVIFQIKFLNNNENIEKILIIGQNAIVYKGIIYKSPNTMIDLENIRKLCFELP